MKLIFVSFLLLFWFGSSANAQDFEQIDATVQFYPNSFDDVNALSEFISRDFKTDEEKVRAIYGWIIHNVAYDPNEYKVYNYKFKDYKERNAKEEITRKKIIQRTLQKGIAVCEGYSMLFEKLCELQGIQNYLVRGDIKTNFNDIGRSFKKLHMWNVAYINEQAYLFDPTWGAGRFHERFIKEPSYYWYKIRPELFIKTHYPDLIEDAYLEKNVSKQTFAKLPLIIHKTMEVDAVVAPINGIISSLENPKEIQFRIKTKAPGTILYAYDFGVKEKIENFEANEDGIVFQVRTRPNSNLVIYFDEQPALAYKVE